MRCAIEKGGNGPQGAYAVLEWQGTSGRSSIKGAARRLKPWLRANLYLRAEQQHADMERGEKSSCHRQRDQRLDKEWR